MAALEASLARATADGAGGEKPEGGEEKQPKDAAG
jgi:hypothetical protein